MTFLGEIIELYVQYGIFVENLIPTLNKETKNKALMFKMQLTTEQYVFVVITYYKARSYLEVNETFHRRFPKKDPPPNRTIWIHLRNSKEKEQV